MITSTPLPAGPAHPFPCEVSDDDARLRGYRIYSFTRNADSAFHFSVALARGWRAVDIAGSRSTGDRAMITLAFLRTPSTPRAEIEVSVARLPREIAAGDCLHLHLAGGGEEVLHRRDLDSEGGYVSDVLSRRLVGGEAVVSRWLAIKDGKHLFVVHARTLEEHYARFAEAFLMALASFRLTEPGSWPLAESLKTFTRRVPGDFLLFYPESWDLIEQDDSGPQALTLTLLNRVGGETAGMITFATVARTARLDAQSLADRYVDGLRRGGVRLEPLYVSPSPPIGSFAETWHAFGRAVRDERAVEVQFVIGKRPDAWFLAGLLGPTRNTAPGVWAVNTRAFDLVLTYLKTPDLDP